jgi:asparagine synthase (glutamine-hydrolysing)
MCGIAGIVHLRQQPIPRLEAKLEAMSALIAHRGPDGKGVWCNADGSVGLAHRRLSIIDLSETGAQPMKGANGTVITQNGEIYNYLELQQALANHWPFRGTSDTEAILAAYDAYGHSFLDHLRGMFAFGIWDEDKRRLVAARDRFGIKPFYYTVVGDIFYFASEAKALLPFLAEIDTDPDALAQYLVFQYGVDDLTLFKGIRQLMPAHTLVVANGEVSVRRYWDVDYAIDWDHSPQYFLRRTRELIDDSVDMHVRSDVPVGAYLSGGIDSSLISILASQHNGSIQHFFHGRFAQPDYDESRYAEAAAQAAGGQLHQIEIGADDFRDNIEKVIYHLDYPVAGPGAFPQYMVSRLAREHLAVVLGGQGGDEIFGGYARYLLAYFEQCISAAIDNTYRNGNYVVTLESILPNLPVLQAYKPMMQGFWREGLFDPIDARYFRLIDRSQDFVDEIDWNALDKDGVYSRFEGIFNCADNVRKEAYFDKMTHFDLKCLLPALLHVEDRMSMAHGLESRVPLVDHELVEFAASVPADVKFKSGNLKHLIKTAYDDVIPDDILKRSDKMGFPVPLQDWFADGLKTYVGDIFSSEAAKTRGYVRSKKVVENIPNETKFSRKTWGLLCLELWQRTFHDQAAEWRARVQ